jgi:DNA-binding NarL/FixJ family response regulator
MKARTPHVSPPAKKFRIVVADTNLMGCRLLADGLERQPCLRVVACVVDSGELLNAVQSAKPDVATISVHLQDGALAGIASVKEIHKRCPTLPLILLLDRTEPQLVIEAFRAGARGVFARCHSDINLLAKCIRRVMEGQIWVDNKQLLYLLDAFAGNGSDGVVRKTAQPSGLTPREESVARLVAEGMGNREIAETLHLSQHTVKNYLVRIFEKLGFSSRVELVLYAVEKLKAADPAGDEPHLPSPIRATAISA